MTAFQDLFEQQAAVAMEKQSVLNDLIGGAEWWLDLHAETLTINKDLIFPVQLLGSDADADQSWLWAWANPHLDLPPSVLRAARDVRTFGEQQQIAELLQPRLSLQQVTGHQLAMVATHICDADGYFAQSYGAGSLFVLLTSPVVRSKLTTAPVRIINVFMKLIQTFSLNHRRAFLAYLAAKDYQAQVNQTKIETKIVACNQQNERIQAHFDDQDRLTELTTTVTPDEKSVA